jgi:hypothetical protein
VLDGLRGDVYEHVAEALPLPAYPHLSGGEVNGSSALIGRKRRRTLRIPCGIHEKIRLEGYWKSSYYMKVEAGIGHIEK